MDPSNRQGKTVGATRGGAVRKIDILVICAANQARSPAAVALFKKSLEEGNRRVEARRRWRRIQSAGIDADPGQPMWRHMTDAMQARGLTPPTHESRLVSPEILRASNLIITMSEDQRLRVNRTVPEVMSRAFTIKEAHRLLTSSRWDPRWDGATDFVQRMHRLRPLVPKDHDSEDVVDPVPGTAQMSVRVLNELDALVADLSAHLLPPEPDDVTDDG